MNAKKLTIAAIAVIAALIIGQGVAYWANPYSNDADISRNGDRLEYSVSSNSSNEYSVLIFTDDFERIDDVHIYYDDERENPSVSHSSQAKHIGYYKNELKKRGVAYTNTDASGLRDLTDEGAGTGKAVLMTSGAFPDTVYNGNVDDPILKWLRSGGTVYWIGDHIGKYVSGVDGVTELEGTDVLFFGTDGAVNTSEGTDAFEPSEHRALGEALSMPCTSTVNGLISGLTDTVYPGFESEGYSSIALTKVDGGTGMVAVFGGGLGGARTSVAQTIAAGVSYMSDPYLHLDGRVRGETAGSADLAGATAAYIYIGKYNTVFGKAFRF